MSACQPRQPRGVPIGGQWRAVTRSEGPRLVTPVPAGYHWWHWALLKELLRIEHNPGPLPAYNSLGLASNFHNSHSDTKRWLAELEAWGFVEESEPLWEARGAKWYRLTNTGRDLARH